MCLSVQSLTEQRWAQNFLIYCSQCEFMFCPVRKVFFKPEKIYGTLSDILAVEMTKCTSGDLLAAFNIKLHVKSCRSRCVTQCFKMLQAKVRTPKQEVSAWFIFTSVVLHCGISLILITAPLGAVHYMLHRNKWISTYWMSSLRPVLPTDTNQNVELMSILK